MAPTNVTLFVARSKEELAVQMDMVYSDEACVHVTFDEFKKQAPPRNNLHHKYIGEDIVLLQQAHIGQHVALTYITDSVFLLDGTRAEEQLAANAIPALKEIYVEIDPRDWRRIGAHHPSSDKPLLNSKNFTAINFVGKQNALAFNQFVSPNTRGDGRYHRAVRENPIDWGQVQRFVILLDVLSGALKNIAACHVYVNDEGEVLLDLSVGRLWKEELTITITHRGYGIECSREGSDDDIDLPDTGLLGLVDVIDKRLHLQLTNDVKTNPREGMWL